MTKIYSYTKLASFEHCPLKYKFRYIDWIIPTVEKSIESVLGKAVHSALEWLYIRVKQGYIPTIDEVIIEYSKEWQEDFNENLVINNPKLTPIDYFNKGIEFLATYYTQNKPFDENTLETEKKIILYLDENKEYKLQGFVDRLAYNLKTKEYEIHDYKTANSIPTKQELEQNKQLALYSIAIKKEFGENKRVTLIWHFLAHNKKIEIKKTNQELEKLKKETIELIKKIESATEFPHQKSRLCNWCEYLSICPAWGNTPPIKQEKNPAKDTATSKKEISPTTKQEIPIKKEITLTTKQDKPDIKDKQESLDKYPTTKKYIKD